MVHVIAGLLLLITGAGTDESGRANDTLKFAEQMEASVQTGKKSIFGAAEEGDSVFIDAYLQDGGNINRSQLYGGTMLYYAVRGGQESVVALLLQRGADPGIAHSMTSLTPVELSKDLEEQSPEVQSGINALLKLALKKQADFNSEIEQLITEKDITKLAVILEGKPFNIGREVYNALLDFAVAEKHELLLGLLAEQLPAGMVSDAVRKKVLESSFVSADRKERIGKSLDEEEKRRLFVRFKYQIIEGYIGVEEKVSPIYTHIDAPDFGGETLLILAVQQGNLKLLKLLLESGASTDSKDSQGLTPREHLERQQEEGEVKSQMLSLLEKYEQGSKGSQRK